MFTAWMFLNFCLIFPIDIFNINDRWLKLKITQNPINWQFNNCKNSKHGIIRITISIDDVEIILVCNKFFDIKLKIYFLKYYFKIIM